MKINKISLIFKKAPFPSIMTIISFVLFIVVYLFGTMTSIEPYYFEGLIFAVPFVCFGITTFFTVTEKLKIVASSVITGILIFVLGFAMLFALVFMSIGLATTVTTDIGKYEKVLKLTDYPNNPLTKYFPDKIPGNTKSIVFSYNPAFLQGGENFDLKFETDSDSIKNYIDEFSHKAKWIGKSSDSEAEKNGVFSGAFNIFGYTDLPEDFTIYLIDSKPYHPNDWNHGELSLAAISKQRNEIIFLAEDW
ncbi:MAG: hypothetical protein ACREV6_04660 [Clostridium sp.]|uniref:hypothetical protein n=1 Tax=Clostridium sp. TaxID=1506 RepID=UPI003D6CC30A